MVKHAQGSPNIEKTENKEDIKNLKVWNIYCKTCKYRMIRNNKNLLISIPGANHVMLIEQGSIQLRLVYVWKVSLVMAVFLIIAGKSTE